MEHSGHAVVVGLDRSTGGRAAVEHAATLAERRHLPLRLVHAFEPSQFAIRPMASWAAEIEGAVRTSAERLMEETVSALAHDHPELPVSSRLQPGSAVVTLVDESRSAACVVLGSRGSGDFVDLLIGSTTLHVASQAHCPVIAVPAPKVGAAPRRGVVVGVDGSADSEEGDRRRLPTGGRDPRAASGGPRLDGSCGPGTWRHAAACVRRLFWWPRRNGSSWPSPWPAGPRSTPTSRSSSRSFAVTRSAPSSRQEPTRAISS